MNKLEERENKRKNSIVGSMIGKQEPEEVKEKKKKTNDLDRVQKAYWIDKDLFKALQVKSIQEDIKLTEAMNKALRVGLKEYL